MVRPSKYNADRQKKIVDAIAAGNYPETSARYGGISVSTYYDWLRAGRREIAAREAGEDPDTGLDWAVSFAADVEDARAKAEVRAVALIQKAAVKTWQAAAWWLERTWPERYAQVRRTEISGPAGSAVRIEATPEDLEGKVRQILGKTEEEPEREQE